ncbi:MAG: hypothetical protein RSP_17380 [Rhodanobacter sp.]
MVGFHGTTSAASAVIETQGFLPNKVFSAHEHTQILELARALGWNTGSYQQWLDMRSVSFAKDPLFAIHHVTNAGNAGGQGLYNVRDALAFILNNGSDESRAVAQAFQQKLAQLRAAAPVIYMVDLSNLGPRLVPSEVDYNMYWNPEEALPAISEIDPGRIIEKLVFAAPREP